MPRRIRSDGTFAAVRQAKRVFADILPPAGIHLKTDEDMRLWRQFTSARDADSWRTADLLMVAKLVRLEQDIRRLNEDMAGQDWLVDNGRGKLEENPLVSIIDRLQKQQLTITRTLGMYAGGNGAISRAQNKRGLEEEQTRKAQPTDDLLAA